MFDMQNQVAVVLQGIVMERIEVPRDYLLRGENHHVEKPGGAGDVGKQFLTGDKNERLSEGKNARMMLAEKADMFGHVGVSSPV